MQVTLKPFAELAAGIPYSSDIAWPQYGRYLEDFSEGHIFVHPRALTIGRDFAQQFATTFHDSCPLFLSAPYAKAHGFNDLLVHPLLIFNIAISLGVQNNSEKAVANLGYYNVRFTAPLYPGDTITARSKVLSSRSRGDGKPGIVHLQTLALKQDHSVVLQYERKVMLPSKTESKTGSTESKTESKEESKAENDPQGLQASKRDGSRREGLAASQAAFAAQEQHLLQLPLRPPLAAELTGSRSYFENFRVGEIIVHKNMRTITDEHIPWSYRTGNTHPLHYDRIYSTGLSGKMSGEPIVYGGLVFAWLAGLASRDCSENMLWDMGYTEGYHTQPVTSGDTIGSISRILAKEELSDSAGLVQFQLIGVKNISTAQALQEYGQELFIKENDKKKLGKEKIAAKIFEIERQLLIKKASAVGESLLQMV